MFGKASFNKSLFNKGSTSMALFINVRSSYSMDEALVSALIDAGEQSIRSQFDMDLPTMSFKVPLGAVNVTSKFSSRARIFAYVNLQPVDVHSAFSVDAASIRLDETEELSLNGIHLFPGDTLIIDTDQLDVQVNGEMDVESWVSGSVFFPLKPGGNIIQVYTSPSGVQLEISVQWADRYL